jgi:hypothetical protein
LPDLIWFGRHHLWEQIGEAFLAMSRIGGALVAPFGSAQQAMFPHDPQDTFVVDALPSARQFAGDPPVPIAVPLQNHGLNVGSKLLILVGGLAVSLTEVPRPTNRMQLTQATHRHRGMRDARIRDHLMPLFKRDVASDFFKMVFSRASWPH